MQTEDFLKKNNLKITTARLAVVKILQRSNEPVDVHSILELIRDKKIKADPATIFRIIGLFKEKGMVKQVQFEEGKFRYELANLNDHHHLICQNCGVIEDVSDCSIGELEIEILKKKGFLVIRHSLEFFGICKKCIRLRKNN